MTVEDAIQTSEQRHELSAGLVQTEMTDAVNSGLVGKADKSAAALKEELFAKGQRASSPEGWQSPPRGVNDQGATAAEGADEAGRGAPPTGPSRVAKALRTGMAMGVHKELAGTELEGLDDLYYQARRVGRLGRWFVRHLPGKDATAPERPLGKLSEKSYEAKEKRQTAQDAQRRMQSRRNLRKGLSKTREAKAAGTATKAAGKAARRGGSHAIAALFATMPQVFLLLAALLLFLLGAALVGGASDEQESGASMQGMPSWVTYDLVLSCLKAHEQYGYPAGALLGQMMIENGTSDEGSSLGRDYHNYGGVKYTGNDYGGLITGSVSMMTGEYTTSGTYYTTYASFAVFASDDAYMTYRCEYLYKQSNYTNVADYQKAIQENDSELFLRALGEGGYYTTSPESYVATYRGICDSYPLVAQLDGMTADEFESQYGGTGSETATGGADLASAEDWQKNIVYACRTVPSPGAGLCATWVSNVYEAAGVPQHGGNGNSMLAGNATSTDWANIKVGQIVSAQASPTRAGQVYGHVAIYVGDGMVMDNVGRIRTVPLSEWVSEYSRYGWVVYGWPF